MSRPLPLRLSVPHPCSQKWDEISPAASSRFCAHCQEKVIDFTGWTDTALYRFFAKNDGPVCGRLSLAQVRKPINIPCQPHSRLYRIVVALGFTLLCTPAPGAHAQNRPPKMEQLTWLSKPASPSPDTRKISGRVLDEKNEPLLYAVVQVFQNGKCRGGTIADLDGNYAITIPDTGFYDVLCVYLGYDSTLVTNVHVHSTATTVNIHMSPRTLQLHDRNQLIVGRIQRFYDEPGTRTFTRNDINNMPH